MATIGLTSTSCADFLDRVDTNGSYVAEGFFNNEDAMRQGAMGVYNMMFMQNFTGFYMVPAVTIFDHWTPMLLERASNTTIGAGGTLNADNALVQTLWSNCYTGIARANEAIFGAEGFKAGFSDKAMMYLAEIHALRAYYYYLLVGIYGDVPFFMTPVPDDQYDSAVRTPREQILDALIADLNEMAPYLPWKRSEIGRLNRGFAYGLINRLGLLGGCLNIGDKGTQYFEAAAAAGKKVIDEGGYQLAANYGDLFNTTGQAKSDVFNEFFYELPYTATATTPMTHTVPYGQGSRIQAQTSRHMSQMFVDTYECIDGLRIDESPLYDNAHPSANRDPRFAVNCVMDGDQMTVNNGSVTTQVISCYNDYTSVYYFNTGTWNHNVLNIDKAGASASWASFCNAGNGIINGKYVHETAENIAASSVKIPVMRYAEILLGYAEAKIELGQLDQSVYDAINTVRFRAGMPGVSDARKGNQSKMRQLVRRERKVELMTEGLHLIDMHRWKTGDIENMYPSYGCPLIEYQYQAGNVYVTDEDETGVSLGLAKTDVPVFKPGREDENDIPCYDAYKSKLKVRDEKRHWNAAFELFPIPTQELNRTTKLVQNPGY